MPNHSVQKEQVLSIDGVGKTGYSHEKGMKLDPYLKTYIKFNSKWIGVGGWVEVGEGIRGIRSKRKKYDKK